MTEVVVHRAGGECQFSQRGTGQVLHGWAEVRLSDGRLLSTRDAPLHWKVQPIAASTFLIQLRFTNTGPAPVHVEQLLPLVSDTGYRSLLVDDLSMSETGWQSWTRAHPPRPFAPNAERAPPPIRSPWLPHREPGSQVAGWMTLLRGRDPGGCLVGFVGGQQQTCVVEVAPRPRGHALRASAETEGVRLAPGRSLASEPLLVEFGEPAMLIETYARLVAEHMQARVAQHIPIGWCSWYAFSTEVTEADVRRNLAVLASARQPRRGGPPSDHQPQPPSELPVEVIQLDDGYQRAVGDWLDVKDTFPSGLAALMRAIRDQGFVPGLWLAPFLLSCRSQTYADHPDWVVRAAATGQPVVAIDNWGSDHYALDTSHPAALAWLEHVVSTLCDTWGVQYLKLDFVYAAALRGRRFDPAITGAQAYARGMQLIRRVAGSRFLLGCGAPLVASVGLVDGMRIGSDVAPFWSAPSDGQAPAGVGPGTFNAVRATLNRAWMHGRWWLNDPDCVLVRAESQLSEVESRSWAAVVALSGGMLMLGDDLSHLDPSRRAWLSRLFPPSGQPLEALGRLVDDTPEHLRLRVERAWSAWTVVGIANWSDTPRAARFEPEAFGLPPATYHLVDLWSGAYHGPVASGLSASIGTLAPHELRLMSVHAALDRPALMGSTAHLLGEALDVLDEVWDGATLRIVLAHGSERSGTLLVAVPAAWRYVPPPPPARPLAEVHPGVLRVELDLRVTRELRLAFEPRGRGA